MTPGFRSITITALMLSMSLSASGQQYFLYAPQPVTSGKRVAPQEGILVEEIIIRKGDTLSGLSRKFNGKGRYYPQIVLFNSIKNPNLIYAGKTLRIPLSYPLNRKKHVSASGDTSQAPRESAGPLPAANPAAEMVIPEPSHQPDTNRAKAPAAPPAGTTAATGQELFEAAVTSYRRNDFRTALEQFDRYLADYADSPLAADASLYKAECYLKLSAQ